MTVTDAQFGDFVARRWTALFRSAYLLTGNPQSAEELAQTALVQVYAARERIRDPDALESYARRTLAHEHVNEVRRLARLRGSPVPEAPVEDHAEAVASREELRHALAALPTRQRAIVIMRFFDDLSVAEVAKALGCTTGTVKKQTHRALSKLQQATAAHQPNGRPARHG